MSDDRELVLASARAEVQRLKSLQPPRERMRMRSDDEYVHSVCAAYDRSPRSGQRRIRLPDRWAADAAEHLVFADLLDPDDFTGNAWIRTLARQTATRTFAQEGAHADPALAEGLGLDALWAVARQIRRRAADPEFDPIDDPLAYFEQVVANMVRRHSAGADPDAVLVDDEAFGAAEEVGYIVVEAHDLVRWIDEVVEQDPFTELDRDVWRRWKEAGFVQRRMACDDMPRKRLRERLRAFLVRLRRVLGLDD